MTRKVLAVLVLCTAGAHVAYSQQSAKKKKAHSTRKTGPSSETQGSSTDPGFINREPGSKPEFVFALTGKKDSSGQDLVIIKHVGDRYKDTKFKEGMIVPANDLPLEPTERPKTDH